MGEGYPQPLERNGCRRRPSMRVVSVFLLIRMGDRGGFNKFGGKWQKKKTTQKGWNEKVKAKGGWWANCVWSMLNVGNTRRVMWSVSGLQVRTSEPRRMSSRGRSGPSDELLTLPNMVALSFLSQRPLEVARLKIPMLPKKQKRKKKMTKREVFISSFKLKFRAEVKISKQKKSTLKTRNFNVKKLKFLK